MKKILVIGSMLIASSIMFAEDTCVGVYLPKGYTDEHKSYYHGYYGVNPNTDTNEFTTVVINDTKQAENWVVGGGINSNVGGTYVKIEGGNIVGEIVGGSVGYGKGSTATVNGDIKIDILGGTMTNNWVVGGNRDSQGVINGNIDITVKGDSEVYGIRGGSMGSSYDQVTNGNVNVFIGGNAKVGHGVADEAISSAGSYATVKDVTVTVAENATINGNIHGGGGKTLTDINRVGANDIAQSEIKNSAENVKINIEGGTVNGDVYGGALKYSGVNSTEINVTGGVINGSVYAGGGENAGKNGDGAFTLVSEGAKINITGGEVTGNVYASGSNSTSVIKGDVVVTLTSDAVIGGTIYGTTNGAVVEGTKTLILDGVSTPLVTVSETKVINAEGFDKVVVDSGNVVELSLKDVDTLAVEQGALVSLTEDASFNNLFVDMSASELESGVSVDLAEIFGDSISVVTSELAKEGSNVVLLDKNQNMFEAEVSGSYLVVTNSIPEPSTYATIFGTLALAFVAYRRRK